ncbi:hypothetical protein F5B19DRAFT_458467 [Rostrohypoxylon terebratum]|nr:hypothetical protein F5B19DRAFT_458467 [Rostrohypoxylon terebratum]
MSEYPHKRITLQVGERRFTTYRRTLINKSPYFAARIGLEAWQDKSSEVDVDADGSYFIDADPFIFKHILYYLRSGDYPIFYDPISRCFDYAKYMALLSQARQFEISNLKEWIEKKEYLTSIPEADRILVFEMPGRPADGGLDFSWMSAMEGTDMDTY